MPTTPDFARAAEVEFEIERLAATLFDAYGSEGKVAELQAKLATLTEELSMLRMPELADAA